MNVEIYRIMNNEYREKKERNTCINNKTDE